MTSDIPSEAVGRRILCDGDYATVRYVGAVPPTTGLWLGVEWDNPHRGKHNGNHEGTQYFSCRHPTGGSFIRPSKANFGIDFLTALKTHYGLNDEQDAECKKEGSLVIGRKTVELVGFDSIKEKQKQLNKLIDISVRECAVSHAGPKEEIKRTCPNIMQMDLSKNLLSSWEKVIDIAYQTENLEILNLSENKMKFPSAPASAFTVFCKLRVLALNLTGVTWTEVMHFTLHFIVPFNVLQTLKILDLSNNQLIENQLYQIAFLPSFQFCNSSPFLFQWSSIYELDKLQRLQSLMCKNNPLMDTEKNSETLRQLIIAKIDQLTFLDKSEIFPEERKGAELDYRKTFGLDWRAAGGNQNPDKNKPNNEFLAAHPRYQLLCLKYGAPEDGELKKQQPFSLKNQLLKRYVQGPDSSAKKILKFCDPKWKILRPKMENSATRNGKFCDQIKLQNRSSKIKNEFFNSSNDIFIIKNKHLFTYLH
uniref:Tubulin-specific chaperone E n=1 Tax=Sphenodon punctatus TaxID=8508 RepID=A0A8D0HNV8_SPHPU